MFEDKRDARKTPFDVVLISFLLTLNLYIGCCDVESL